ncbi:hypothetical protein SAMN05216338_104748 [Bradyrhizobium sp. Rc2d]|nr:hypothetical protein SAMN05216338_104748 [Bradyrhizobium sp. Rc2d]
MYVQTPAALVSSQRRPWPPLRDAPRKSATRNFVWNADAAEPLLHAVSDGYMRGTSRFKAPGPLLPSIDKRPPRRPKLQRDIEVNDVGGQHGKARFLGLYKQHTVLQSTESAVASIAVVDGRSCPTNDPPIARVRRNGTSGGGLQRSNPVQIGRVEPSMFMAKFTATFGESPMSVRRSYAMRFHFITKSIHAYREEPLHARPSLPSTARSSNCRLTGPCRAPRF